jgi:hypothetical protein
VVWDLFQPDGNKLWLYWTAHGRYSHKVRRTSGLASYSSLRVTGSKNELLGTYSDLASAQAACVADS